MAAFGFCFLTASNCHSSLVHTFQPQLFLTGIMHHSRLQVSLSYFDLTFNDVVGGRVWFVFYLGNVLHRQVEHLFVSMISKLILQCETIIEVHKNYREDENEIQNDQVMVRTYGEFSAGAYLIVSSEPPAAIVAPNLSPYNGAGELDEPTTNIQSLQSEDEQRARRGPTGPRSKIGKQRSSRNAIKSGLFAKATVLPGECRAEYESLRQRLWKAKQPGDEYEELLLDMIVSNVWRQLRGSEPKEVECKFTKRTHLNHVKSVVSVFQGQRKQGGSGDIRCKRRGGTDRDTHNIGISLTERKVVAWLREQLAFQKILQGYGAEDLGLSEHCAKDPDYDCRVEQRLSTLLPIRCDRC